MEFPLSYPLNMSFKIMALSPQIAVTDANGNLILYVKQKLFKLREQVTVFADREQTRPVYRINADRIIDFSARYNFSDTAGNDLGAIKRKGMKSIWKAHYDILVGDEVVMTIQEANPWIKVLDAILGEIPVVGMFTGYLLHPAYLFRRPGDEATVLMKLKKLPAFLEGKFSIEKLADLSVEEEQRALLSTLMMLLLERARG